MSTTTILYPQGAKFNMDYYLSSHMPTVQKLWGPAGLKSWKVLTFGPDAPYCVQATLEWPDLATFQKAAGGEHTAHIMGDVANFSDKQPTLIPGEVVGSSS